ncbi:MAG: antibiotic biosynthesis monooxygenase family protein [Sporichthyaceae bacterium]
MSYIAINVLSVGEGMGPVLEERFANRAGTIEESPGFEGFQLMRPESGTDKYFVLSKWATKEDFETWRDGPGRIAHAQERERAAAAEGGAPAQGHGHGQGGGGMAAMSAELWTFNTVLDVSPR